jgi:hypothetical protein
MTFPDSYRTDYEFLVKSIQGIVWEADPDTFRFTFVSEYAERILGFSLKEWLSEGFWVKHIHPEDRERVVDARRKATVEGLHHEFDYRLIGVDGRIVWFRDTVFVDMQEGRPVRLRGTLIDISAQKRLESQIRQQEETLRLLASGSKDAIFRFGYSPTRCEYMSAAIADITGYTPEEYYADPHLLWNIVDPRDQHLLIRSALMAPSGEPVVLRITRKDGRVIWAEHRNVAVYNDSGQVVAIEGTARDITERITLEARLNQAQKMEVIGRLVSGVIHDFNNVLTVILLYSGLVLQRIRAEDPLKQHVEGIRRAGERGALLTRQLLALGRRRFVVPAILDLNAVVEDMKGMLTRLVGEHIEFVTRLSPEVGHIKADLSQIEQVILNVVINARDAMSHGGKLIIETSAVGPYAALSVSDTGTGIDAETLKHVFEPFFTTKPEGTGLGLATVNEIVTQSGGDISVETDVDAGTTFRILLPRTNAAVTRIETPKPEPAKRTSHETVLLVEDDDQVRIVTAQVLETEGYRVFDAKTAAEALLIYQTSIIPIDLLLTDLVLTDMDGVGLAARISAMKQRTVVLYMSGYSDRDLIKLGNFDPNRTLIQKPFNPKALIEKMRQLLDTLES